MAPRTRKAAASPSPAPTPQNGVAAPPLPPKDDAPATPTVVIDALLVPVTGEEREQVKVNNASASDMKHACDDALKRVRLSSPLLLLYVRTCTRRPRPWMAGWPVYCCSAQPRWTPPPLAAPYVTYPLIRRFPGRACLVRPALYIGDFVVCLLSRALPCCIHSSLQLVIHGCSPTHAYMRSSTMTLTLLHRS